MNVLSSKKLETVKSPQRGKVRGAAAAQVKHSSNSRCILNTAEPKNSKTHTHTGMFIYIYNWTYSCPPRIDEKGESCSQSVSGRFVSAPCFLFFLLVESSGGDSPPFFPCCLTCSSRAQTCRTGPTRQSLKTSISSPFKNNVRRSGRLRPRKWACRCCSHVTHR